MSTAPAVCTGSGKTSQLALAAWATATAEHDSPRSRRVRGLLDELSDIATDRELAHRFTEPGTWLSELRTEEREIVFFFLRLMWEFLVSQNERGGSF